MAVPVEELTRSDGVSPTSLQCALTAFDGVVKGIRPESGVGGTLPSLSELLEKLEPRGKQVPSGQASTPPETPGFKPHPPLSTSFSDPAQSSSGGAGGRIPSGGDGSANKGNPHANIKLAAKAVRVLFPFVIQLNQLFLFILDTDEGMFLLFVSYSFIQSRSCATCSTMWDTSP